MRLDRLVKSQKIKDRWYAEFEDGERFAVNTALIADFSLFTGRELDDAEYESLKRASELQAVKARALRILGTRSMSRREITNRLLEKGESEAAVENTVSWLESIGAVNDAEYAFLVARHYAAKGYGRSRIRDELYRRGVPRDLWDAALEELPESDDRIDALIERKLCGRIPDKAERKRLSDMLMRRGYSWDEISSALRRLDDMMEERHE